MTTVTPHKKSLQQQLEGNITRKPASQHNAQVNQTNTLIKVAIPAPLPTSFTYLPPQGLSALECPVGARVRVPFGRRKLIGIVTGHSQPEPNASYQLKKAEQLIDTQSLIPESLWRLSQWCARYYHEPLGSTLYQILPKKIREGAELEIFTHQFEAKFSSQDLSANLLSRSPKQLKALNHLMEHGPLCLKSLRLAGFTPQIIDALASKGMITESKTLKWHDQLTKPNILASAPLQLNKEQENALQQIIKTSDFGTFLLDGVTGSGKTEVYLQAIQHCLSKGKQALILIPEINLTPQTIERFKQRFSAPIAAYHSQLNDSERIQTWLRAKLGHARIIIGTRSAIFLPLKAPGLFIVDEEHDSSFKQQDNFRYHARDTAIYRAKMENIPIILGSATPALESWHNAQIGKYSHLRLKQRPTAHPPPTLEFVDIRGIQLKAGLSKPTIEAIQCAIKEEQQVLVFLNRRGFAPVLICHHCGKCLDCEDCNTHLTWHKSQSNLKCHHCLHQRPVPQKCPSCLGTQLNAVGQGTERIEESLGQLFPGVTVLRIDADTTSRKTAYQELRKQINTGKPMILVGTQMLSKGHHFPNVTLSVILNADSGLLSVDFRGSEKLAQLIVQVAGRSGRGNKAGRVLLQTLQPEHPVLKSLGEPEGYASFAQMALRERKAAHMPPFAFQALIRAEAKNPSTAHEFLCELKSILTHSINQASPNRCLQTLGPVSAPMAKRAGLHRFQLLLQANDRPTIAISLERMHEKLAEKKLSSIRWSVDIDPIDLY